MDAGHLATVMGVAIFKGFLYFAGWVVGSILLLKLALRRLAQHRRKLAANQLDDIDRMSREQFEEYLEVLFERLGYVAYPTERFDKGADLILAKEGVRTA